MIAAIAIANGLPLYTCNPSDFEGIAGLEVIETLRDAGVEDQFEDFNRRAVELAIEARTLINKPDVLVAGGMSYWSFIDRHPPLEDLLKDATEQAAIMATVIATPTIPATEEPF